MKISLIQQNYVIGDIKGNTDKIINTIEEEKKKGTDLIVFSELCVSGYPPRDLLYIDDFILQCEAAVMMIASVCDGVGALIGVPIRNPEKEGKDLYNSVLFIDNGEIVQEIHKTLLPTYDVFDEYRYFEPAQQWNCIQFKGHRIAVTICEDIWNLGNNPLYKIAPMDHLIKQAPELIINLSASPFDYTHKEDREAILLANVLRYGIPLIYCNSVGSQTEIVFDGGSMVMNSHGDLHVEMSYFKEDRAIIEWTSDGFADPIIRVSSDLARQELDPQHLDFNLHIDRVYNALVMGIQDYFQKMGFRHAVLGASGGIDSAVTQALAVAALGKENVTVLMMPSQFSTSHSIDDAVKLTENLGNAYHIIEIESLYQSFEKQLSPIFQDMPFDVTEENIQSRCRGVLLMAFANKFGNILLNTSNKSELAVGYGTLYGDMAGGIGILGDVYKMQVYALANYINQETEIIPNHIITKAPSAELRPGQKDSDSLPDYQELDTVLYQYVERALGPEDIIAQGYDEDLVYRIIGMVNRNEYKRAQFCPIIRVSPKAFGIGRRIPIVARYLD